MKPLMLRKKKKFVAVARRKTLSARMGDTRDYRMTTLDSVLRRSLDDRSGELILTLDPRFQGLPDTAHGGSVLAAFDALAGLTGPAHLGGAPARPGASAAGVAHVLRMRRRQYARPTRAARVRRRGGPRHVDAARAVQDG